MGRKYLARSEFKAHEERANLIRKCLVQQAKKIKSKDVSIMLSSGVDSHACLFAALEAKKNVTVFSFCLDDRESKDFKVARETAKTFGLNFIPVSLSTDLQAMKSYLTDLYKLSTLVNIHVNKSSVECLYALFRAFDEIVKTECSATILGLGGDLPFAMLRSQRKKIDNYEKGVIDPYVESVVVNKNDVQTLMINAYLKHKKANHKVYTPFHTLEFISTIRGMHPDDGNKPIQKAPVRLAFFDYFEKTNVLVHQSFQKGDSGISDHFSSILLSSDWNTRKLKSVVGIYNDLETGVLPPKKQTKRNTLFGKSKQV